MKSIIAKEFLFFFIALIISVPVGILFLFYLNPPAWLPSHSDTHVLQMTIFLLGVLIGFVGIYLTRATIWAVKTILLSNEL